MKYTLTQTIQSNNGSGSSGQPVVGGGGNVISEAQVRDSERRSKLHAILKKDSEKKFFQPIAEQQTLRVRELLNAELNGVSWRVRVSRNKTGYKVYASEFHNSETPETEMEKPAVIVTGYLDPLGHIDKMFVHNFHDRTKQRRAIHRLFRDQQDAGWMKAQDLLESFIQPTQK